MKTLLTSLLIACFLLPNVGFSTDEDKAIAKRLKTNRVRNAWNHCGRAFSVMATSKKGPTVMWLGIGTLAVVAPFLVFAHTNEREMRAFMKGPLPHEDDINPIHFKNMVRNTRYDEERLLRTELFLLNVSERGEVFSEALKKAFISTHEPNLIELMMRTQEERNIALTRIIHLFQFLPEQKQLNYEFLLEIATGSLDVRDPIPPRHLDTAMETILKMQVLDKDRLPHFVEQLKKHGTDFSDWTDDFYVDMDREVFWEFVRLYYLTPQGKDGPPGTILKKMTTQEQDALVSILQMASDDGFQGAPEDVLRVLLDGYSEAFLKR